MQEDRWHISYARIYGPRRMHYSIPLAGIFDAHPNTTLLWRSVNLQRGEDRQSEKKKDERRALCLWLSSRKKHYQNPWALKSTEKSHPFYFPMSLNLFKLRFSHVKNLDTQTLSQSLALSVSLLAYLYFTLEKYLHRQTHMHPTLLSPGFSNL